MIPWMGSIGSPSMDGGGRLQSQHLKCIISFFEFCLSKKSTYIFVLDFFFIPYHSLSPSPIHESDRPPRGFFILGSLATSRSIQEPPDAYFMPLSSPPVPSFNATGPPPPVQFSPYTRAYGREGSMDKWEAVFPPHQIIGFSPIPGLVLSCKLSLLTHSITLSQ